MIKYAMLGAALVLLSGCEGYNAVLCLQSVQAEMPNADVAAVPGKKFHFIAKEHDGSVWYLETMNQMDAKVSTRVRVIKGDK